MSQLLEAVSCLTSALKLYRGFSNGEIIRQAFRTRSLSKKFTERIPLPSHQQEETYQIERLQISFIHL
jgi:hypothetical protein